MLVNKSRPSITGTTHTLPFHQLSPREFERLCLWLVQREGYERAEHLGAVGSEQGRDVVAWREGRRWVFQCKRVQSFGPRDALAEIEKILALPADQQPADLLFIVTCDVSANTRQQARERCVGGMMCHFWARTELDALVKRCPDIVDEFFQVAERNIIQRILGTGPDERRALRNRRAMLELVRSFWVKGVLEQSLHGAAMIDLGMEERIDAVVRPWDMVLHLPDRPNRELPPGTKILDIFDEMNQSLLILGKPGSGKTTMLLELARDTIARAEEDLTQPIPAVFNLSSWSKKRQPLADWLVEELNTKYNIPKRIARPWIENDDLLLLLDGLDEVAEKHRDACVEAINEFREEHGLAPMAVCSRVADYEALTERLVLQGALLLQSLTPEQIDRYLIDAGDELLTVRGMLRQDPILQKLAQTPLMLNIIVLTCQEVPSDDPKALATTHARRRYVFDTYVKRMLRRRGVDQLYSRERTVHWLVWLARQMSQNAQTVFLIEGLQPSWLSLDTQRRLHTICVFLVTVLSAGLPSGIAAGHIGRTLTAGRVDQAFGLAIGIAFGLTTFLASRRLFGIREGAAVGGAFGIALVLGLPTGKTYGLIQGITIGGITGGIIGVTFTLVGNLLLGGRTRREISHIELFDRLSWSWPRFVFGLMLGMTMGVILELCASVGRGEPFSWMVHRLSSLLAGNEDFWLRYELIVGLTLGPIVGIISGFTGYRVEQTVLPNQAIWRSLRNAVLAGSFTWLTVAASIGVNSVPAFGLRGGILVGGCTSLAFGVSVGAFLGGLAVLQHCVLRFLLAVSGDIPWNLVCFLDYATERIFLRKVGGGYIFIHRLLQDYFASLYKDQ